MKIALTQQPAPAGAITENQDRVFDALGKAVAEGAGLLLTPADPLAGDAGDMTSDPGFALDLRLATIETVRAAGEEGARISLDPDLSTFITRDGLKITLATVTDPNTLTAATNTAVTLGSDVLAISAALPYQMGAPEARRAELVDAAHRTGMTILFCNRVGGQDENVYDGGSMVIGPDGTVAHQSPLFEDDIVTLSLGDLASDATVSDWPDADEQVWAAMVLGTRDYVRNSGFADVVIGLSGGIDSAVVAAIAVEALGAEHVHGIGMPGPYSSEGSVTDARALADNLGIGFDIASIKDTYEAEVAALGGLLDGPGAQVAKENIQARLRSLHLFTVANARNALVLNTCNKSEDAVGYATYGGDSMGAYAPLADASKTLVYRLAAWHNRRAGSIGQIPQASITKPPSAELAPGQQDTDTLPPYDILDTIIGRYLQRRESADQIVAALRSVGADAHRDVSADVKWVLKMIDRNEWKRQQAPLGTRLTSMPFAARKVPIVNGRRHHLSRR